jgi:hypothetical protein
MSPIHQSVPDLSPPGKSNIRPTGEGQAEHPFIELDEIRSPVSIIDSPTSPGDREQVNAFTPAPEPVDRPHRSEHEPSSDHPTPGTILNGTVPGSVRESSNIDGAGPVELDSAELDRLPQRGVLHPDPVADTSNRDVNGDRDRRAARHQSRDRFRWLSRPVGPILQWVLVALLVVSIALNIALSVPGGILRRPSREGLASLALNLTVTTLAVADGQPILDSSLGAAAIVLSTPFTLNPENETKLVYNGDNSKICVRTKSKGHWRANIQCIEGANPKNNTPLTMLDWLGGPSIYFFTTKNRLSGIDYVPISDSWRLSSIVSFGIAVGSQSQLASMTWRNGTSAWLYYQVPDGQIWELGMDDFRDQIWHDGPTGGSLGKAATGSGIGVTRWIGDGAEVEEIFFAEEDGPIVERMYANSRWIPGTMSIKGTADKLRIGATISASTVRAPAGDIVVLAFVSKDGFLNVQTRRTANVSDYTDYSSPIEIVEGNAHLRTGVAVVDLWSMPTVYFMNGRQIVEASRLNTNSSAGNWTFANI